MSGIPEIIGELFSSWEVKPYKETFTWFWKDGDAFVETADTPGGKAANILIIWDDMPSRKDTSPIDILSHLTPIDWALSISRHLLNKSKNGKEELPPLRILVLDRHSHEMPGAFSCRMLDSILPALPWVRWCRLLPKPGTDKRSPSNRYDPEALKEALSKKESIPALSEFRADVHVRQRVDALVHAWIGHLSQSGDHHSINNLLGPMVLSTGFGKDIRNAILDVSSEKKALLQHLRWLGLVHEDEEKEKQGGDLEWFKSTDAANRLGIPINYVLIDDQANNGWVDVLAGALGLKRIEESDDFVEASGVDASGNGKDPSEVAKGDKTALWASTSWKFLLDKLEALLNDGKYDCRFQLGFLNGESSTGEVLLLDLRLERYQKKEKAYLKKTLELAKKLADHFEKKGNNWPWVPLQLKTLGKWLDGLDGEKNRGGNDWRTDEEYIEFLTLLPRIISTMDLSLPIVVFSSSGKRKITEALKDFGNVITGFEKPRLMGTVSEEIVEQTKSQIEEVFNQVKDILSARLFCSSLPQVNSRDVSGQGDQQRNEWVIELYVDETGSESNQGGLTVSGIVAIFPPGVNSEEFDKKIKENLKNILLSEEGKEELRNQAEQQMRFVMAQANQSRVQLSIVSLSGLIENSAFDDIEDYGDLDDERVVDNLWRELVLCLTEIAIYHYSKKYCPHNANVSFRVYYPTRHGGSITKDRAEKLFHKWGLLRVNTGKYPRSLWNALDELEKVEDNNDGEIGNLRKSLRKLIGGNKEEKRIRYFNYDSARPLVQRLTQQYRWAGFRPKAEHARAYGLNTAYGTGTRHFIRSLHFLSDAVIGKTGNCINKLREEGFNGQYNWELQELLRAARSVSNSFVGRGLAIASQIPIDWKNTDRTSDIKGVLVEQLQCAAQVMLGSEFAELVQRSAEPSIRKFSGEEKGVVISCQGGYWGIESDGGGHEYRVPRSSVENIKEIGDRVKFSRVRGNTPGRFNITNVQLTQALIGREIDGQVKNISSLFGALVQLDIDELKGYKPQGFLTNYGNQPKAISKRDKVRVKVLKRGATGLILQLVKVIN